MKKLGNIMGGGIHDNRAEASVGNRISLLKWNQGGLPRENTVETPNPHRAFLCKQTRRRRDKMLAMSTVKGRSKWLGLMEGAVGSS